MHVFGMHRSFPSSDATHILVASPEAGKRVPFRLTRSVLRADVRVRALQEELVSGSKSLDEIKKLLDVIPAQRAQEILDDSAQKALHNLETVNLKLKDYTVEASFLGPDSASPEGLSPVVLLHGFDGSCIGTAYHRLKPVLDESVQTWALDLLGDGFSNIVDIKPGIELGPLQRRQHLYEFWRTKIQRPMTLTGVSLGGAAAVDFALAHPEAVDKLVLLAPQVMQDGIGPMSSLPRPVAKLGVKLLQTTWLRTVAEKQFYHEPEQFATADSVNLARLHTFLPGWEETRLAFMRSGGYRVSGSVKQIQQPTTVIWGASDKVLPPKGAQAFVDLLPNARLVMLEKCGHGLHLERPEAVAQAILEAVRA